MFSEMIQSLLSSGGKTAAMQRYSQLNCKVAAFKNQVNGSGYEIPQNPMDTIYPSKRTNVSEFENILKSTTTDFGSIS